MCAGLCILLTVLFVLWEIREYMRNKRFAADIYAPPNWLRAFVKKDVEK